MCIPANPRVLPSCIAAWRLTSGRLRASIRLLSEFHITTLSGIHLSATSFGTLLVAADRMVNTVMFVDLDGFADYCEYKSDRNLIAVQMLKQRGRKVY